MSPNHQTSKFRRGPLFVFVEIKLQEAGYICISTTVLIQPKDNYSDSKRFQSIQDASRDDPDLSG